MADVSTNKSLKYILIALGVLILGVIAFVIYRMFFQFSAKDVKAYVNDEAIKYTGSEKEAYEIIMDGVEYILSSNNLTQQVIKSARASKIEKEQELVHAAIMQCKAFNYLGEKAPTKNV